VTSFSGKAWCFSTRRGFLSKRKNGYAAQGHVNKTDTFKNKRYRHEGHEENPGKLNPVVAQKIYRERGRAPAFGGSQKGEGKSWQSAVGSWAAPIANRP
jgi:hypothetical protein